MKIALNVNNSITIKTSNQDLNTGTIFKKTKTKITDDVIF
jgi:hypothetical protein